jgi:hypothetical protein
MRARPPEPPFAFQQPFAEVPLTILSSFWRPSPTLLNDPATKFLGKQLWSE